MIDRPGLYFKLGGLIEYKKRGLLEGIWIKGPISDDIKIMVSLVFIKVMVPAL